MKVVIRWSGESESPAEPAVAGRFARLPDPVRVEDTISTKEASPPPDPELGRDTQRDFMLRYAG